MCGRYSLKILPGEIASAFDIAEENLPVIRYGRFNIAPSQQVLAIRISPQNGEREVVTMKWGLIPSWAKEDATGLINARAETVSEKPSFRKAFRERRCLVIADGFYEWKKVGDKKQPYYFSLQSGRPFAFAGIYEQSKDGAEEATTTCALITTEANAVVREVHERMPVILSDPNEWRAWLLGETEQDLKALLRPLADDLLTATPVSTAVNNPRNDTEECVRSLG